MPKLPHIDSSSVGDPARFRDRVDLERSFAALPGMPQERGRVALLIRKGEAGRREAPGLSLLTPEVGVTGDAWSNANHPDGEAQIAVMQRDVAELLANGQSLALFGDNLFLELDLSAGNLPAGSRVRVGAATLEVTPLPHTGCVKFRSRFGDEALRFISRRELRPRNLRGVYMRVVEPGEVRPGDPVEVVFRPSPA